MHKFKTSIIFCLFIALLFSSLIISCDKKKDEKEVNSKTSKVVQTKWEDIEEETPPQKLLKKKPLSIKKKPAAIKKIVSKRSQTQYQIQFAAFIKPGNAERFYRKMKRKGYNVKKIRNKSGSKTWHTIRLMGFKTLTEAQKKAEQIAKKESIEVAILKRNSFSKIVRSPVQASKRKVTKKISVATKTKFTKRSKITKTKFVKPVTRKKMKAKYVGPLNYCFQVGGLLSAPVAIAQRDKLKKKGYKTFILREKDTMNNEEWSTVQVGYFQTLLKADQAALDFFKIENIPTKARDVRKN